MHVWLLLYRYVGVVFDEMYIREDLVFDKHQCRLVGFVNVADFGNQMQHLEERRSDLVSHLANEIHFVNVIPVFICFFRNKLQLPTVCWFLW